MTENFPKLTLNSSPQIQKAQKSPSMKNAEKTIPEHITLKLQKVKGKEKFLKEAGVRNLNYRETNIANFKKENNREKYLSTYKKEKSREKYLSTEREKTSPA